MFDTALSHANPACDELIELFDQVFFESENACLVLGNGEPIYLPADQSINFHQIVFAHGYFSSALHEIAHWCVAGKERRKLIDYGYWYEPDGRIADQQTEFELVEVKPQALEWIFTVSAKRRFFISADNLSGEETNAEPFKDAVYQQVINYCRDGLSYRAESFRRVLSEHYKTSLVLSANDFSRSDL